MYIDTLTYLCIRMHRYIYIDTLYVHMCTYSSKYMHGYICIHVCMYASIYIYRYTYMYTSMIYICVSIFMWVHSCEFIHVSILMWIYSCETQEWCSIFMWDTRYTYMYTSIISICVSIFMWVYSCEYIHVRHKNGARVVQMWDTRVVQHETQEWCSIRMTPYYTTVAATCYDYTLEYMCMHVYVYVYAYAFIHVYIYLWLHSWVYV